MCLDPGQGQGEESVTVTVFSTSGREQGVEVEAGWQEGGIGLGEEGQREVQLSAGSTQVGYRCSALLCSDLLCSALLWTGLYYRCYTTCSPVSTTASIWSPTCSP